MKKFQRIYTVVPSLPKPLRNLHKIAQNVWFSWNTEAIKLFQRLDPQLWTKTNHNPVRLLRSVSQERVDEICRDEGFLAQIEKVFTDFEQYIKISSSNNPSLKKARDLQVAYFSAEYGLCDCLALYSGGLGVLAGDFLKSASDIRLPLTAVGLLYKKGFFSQYIDESGWQRENYPETNPDDSPMDRVTSENGDQLSISVDLAGVPVTVKVWKINVGRVTLYLLDTDTPENNPEFREITSQLYAGEKEMRLRQEILLGVGGVRVLEMLGIKPSVFHMNEGHAAFVALERIRNLIKSGGLSFRQAKEMVRSQCVFTTHTPVPAGNDRFHQTLMEKYFNGYLHEIGLPFHEFMALGRESPDNLHETFCMTVLALKLSCKANGVSELHSNVSREMWQKVWPDLPLKEIPIIPITNGVHIKSWVSNELSALYERHLGMQWAEEPDYAKVWQRVAEIPESELWRTHSRRRENLVAFVRRKLQGELLLRDEYKSEINRAAKVLDPKALTIGFARRFATYKRGDLLFRDPERLEKILNNEKWPVQVIFSGKSHPQDQQGKEIIKKIINFSREPRFRDKIVFLEDYNINIARFMVQGVDVWLNNPLPPLEACGTSGMKAAINGVLNLSILDGWWWEAYSRDNGWCIGRGEHFKDREYQDAVESRNIYNILEQEVVPLFYERGFDNVPRKWVALMKNCLRSICPLFNSHRMSEEYLKKFYLPCHETWQTIYGNGMKGGKDLTQRLENAESKWKGIRIDDIRYDKEMESMVGDSREVEVKIFLNGLGSDDVSVDLYHGHIDSKVNFIDTGFINLESDGAVDKDSYVFTGQIPCEKAGRFGFVVRVLPKHENLIDPYQTGLILWG